MLNKMESLIDSLSSFSHGDKLKALKQLRDQAKLYKGNLLIPNYASFFNNIQSLLRDSDDLKCMSLELLAEIIPVTYT